MMISKTKDKNTVSEVVFFSDIGLPFLLVCMYNRKVNKPVGKSQPPLLEIHRFINAQNASTTPISFFALSALFCDRHSPKGDGWLWIINQRCNQKKTAARSKIVLPPCPEPVKGPLHKPEDSIFQMKPSSLFVSFRVFRGYNHAWNQLNGYNTCVIEKILGESYLVMHSNLCEP